MNEQPLPADHSRKPPPLQFRLAHLLYATALLGAGLATFQTAGAAFAICLLVMWAYVVSERARVYLYPLMLFFGMGLWIAAGFCGAMLSSYDETCHDCRRLNHKFDSAFRYYERNHLGCLPPYLADENGRPLHSWRVLLLPYLGEAALYDQYRFDEPWDSPHNRLLLDQMPDAYLGRSGYTPYRMVAYGKHTILFEAGAGRPWLEPSELSLDEAVALMHGNNVVADEPCGSTFYFASLPHRHVYSLGSSRHSREGDLRLNHVRFRPRWENWIRLTVLGALLVLPLAVRPLP